MRLFILSIKSIAILLILASLSGCWFFIIPIPGSQIAAAEIKPVVASDIFYTDGSKEIAFDVCKQALKNLGYSIDITDKRNFALKGSSFYAQFPIYVNIQIEKDSDGVSISYILSQTSAVKTAQKDEYYLQLINDIQKEISRLLNEKGYKLVIF